MFKYLCHFPLVIAALGAFCVPIEVCFSKIRMEWMPLVVLAAKCQTAVERNTALQWWCTEAPGRKAGAIKWKIPAEDVFPFLMRRKRVLFEAAGLWKIQKTQGRWENDLIELWELKQANSFSQHTTFLRCFCPNNKLTYKLYNHPCAPVPNVNVGGGRRVFFTAGRVYVWGDKQ